MRKPEADGTRDAARTQEAILVAAEDHFAHRGFDATSLHQIAETAGVARSTPVYFFKSKEALYAAVLARVVARGREAMGSEMERRGEGAVESFVGALLEFLSRDRNFVRLIQREALGDGSRVAEFFEPAVQEAVSALAPAAEEAGISPQRLVLDLAALCWYPLAHEHTLMPALGINARDPAFLEEQKRHLVQLVRGMTRGKS